jgi:hypothetical protein
MPPIKNRAYVWFYNVFLAISLLLISPIASALTLYQGQNLSKSKKLEWNNFKTHTILERRASQVTSEGYTTRVNLDIHGGWGTDIYVPIGSLMGQIYLPWVTFVVDVDSKDFLMKEDLEFGMSIVIGDFNRFPAYLQVGILSSSIGRYRSELLLPQFLTTRQLFYSSYGTGVEAGCHYSFGSYGLIKLAMPLVENISGIKGQWDIPLANYALIEDNHIIIGGGLYDVETGKSLKNLYVEMSGREQLRNNLIKVRFERLGKIYKRDVSNNASHAEVSYHCPLYYFGNPSACVVGYSTSTKEGAYGFGGVKINCFSYFDIGFGMKCGKFTSAHTKVRGWSPFFNMQLSI